MQASIESQLDQFTELGYAVVPDVFTAAECDRIIEHVERAAFGRGNISS